LLKLIFGEVTVPLESLSYYVADRDALRLELLPLQDRPGCIFHSQYRSRNLSSRN